MRDRDALFRGDPSILNKDPEQLKTMLREAVGERPEPPGSRQRLVRVARMFARRRVPFRHQGRALSGMDCIGLVICAATAIGLKLPDRSGYARDLQGRELEHAMDEHLIRLLRPEPGAVILLRFNDAKRHVALLGTHDMIHAWDRVGYVCRHDYADWFRDRTAAVYRIPGTWT